MSVPEADFILIGTGLAPLVAAQRLLSEGASVMLLNPAPAAFTENSELSLTPFLLLGPGTTERCRFAAPAVALDELRPVFPGALEFEPTVAGASSSARIGSGFSDPLAPRLRTRDHFLLFSSGGEEPEPGMDAVSWESLSRGAGLHPRRLDELTARLRIPGLSSQRRQEWLGAEDWDVQGGLQIARLCDVDLERFRRGILDFVQEKLGTDLFCMGTGLPEFAGPHAVRLNRGRSLETVRAGTAVVVFSSASTLPWQLKQSGVPESLGARLAGRLELWEHWTLLSREDLDPGVVIHLGKHAVIYAELEGAAGSRERVDPPRSRLLRVIRRTKQLAGGASSPLSERSIRGLASLCTEDLGWERFSIRALRTGASLLAAPGAPALLRELRGFHGRMNFWTVPGSGGPVVEVVAQVNRAVDELLASPERVRHEGP